MRVLDVLVGLFSEKYGCEPEDVEMAASLDELNIAPHEREDMAMILEEMYGVAIEDEALFGFETVEDIVGYVEDILNEEG
jgi:acyl carrier protein